MPEATTNIQAPQGSPAKAAATPKKTGGTVTIACKLPNGVLAEVWDMDPEHAMTVSDGQGGKRTIYQRIPYSAESDKLLIKGNAAERRLETADDRGVPRDGPPLESVVCGFGLTTGVDADWAALWFEQNKQWPPVARGMIFMAGTTASARDQARDHKGIVTKLEPINPLKPAPDIEPEKDEMRRAAGLTKAA
jgi:hypothetical protein